MSLSSGSMRSISPRAPRDRTVRSLSRRASKEPAAVRQMAYSPSTQGSTIREARFCSPTGSSTSPGPPTARCGHITDGSWAMTETTLVQKLAKVVTPNGESGGIWQSQAGPSADASGNVYLTVGDGTATAPKGGQDYGNAFLKLSPSGEVLDWFIPFNFEDLDSSRLRRRVSRRTAHSRDEPAHERRQGGQALSAKSQSSRAFPARKG